MYVTTGDTPERAIVVLLTKEAFAAVIVANRSDICLPREGPGAGAEIAAAALTGGCLTTAPTAACGRGLTAGLGAPSGAPAAGAALGAGAPAAAAALGARALAAGAALGTGALAAGAALGAGTAPAGVTAPLGAISGAGTGASPAPPAMTPAHSTTRGKQAFHGD
jgi:hypothetical protein